MHRSMFFIVLLTPTFLLAAPDHNIPRFQKVAEGFYRGGQPQQKGFEYLKAQGIHTIINLREENDEEPTVRSLGMNYVHIPMTVSMWSRISDADISKYFQVMNDPANYPVYIHCQRGADRTGVMVGFYRIAAQGWEGQKAYDEARNIGMRWWYPGLKDQLYGFKKNAEASNWTILPAAALPAAR
jgi:protein tyrosine/serine phosphatase